MEKAINSQQYSNSDSSLKNLNNSNSTVNQTTVLRSFTDLIHNQEYMPFYIRKLNELGVKRFTELANKARAGSNTPAKLFSWMLKHNELVK